MWTGSLVKGLIVSAYCVLLFVISVTDVVTRRIPNTLVAAVCAVGIARLLVVPAECVSSLWYPGPSEAFLSAVCILFTLFGLEMVWRQMRRGVHGMGFGDIKLIAASSLMLGTAVVPAIAVACFLAALLSVFTGKRQFAFGPYLCISFASWVIWFALI